MKKTFSKIVLTAAVAATMLASSLTALAAGNASVSIDKSSVTAKPGETVSFTVSVTNDNGTIGGIKGTVAAEGLTPAGNPTSNMIGDVTADMFGVITSPGVEAGTVTYTYTVPADAKDGETYTFSATLTEALDYDTTEQLAIANSTVSATVTVKADQQEPTDPTDPGKDEPTTPSNPSNPSNNKPANKDLDDVPKTGDATSNMMAYMVVAIAAAGAIAVVSAKKLAR